MKKATTQYVTRTLSGGKRNLEYFQSPQQSNKEKPTLLVVANSYGVLTYTKEFLQIINQQDRFNAYAFNLSGQGNSEGEVSLENLCEDLDHAINFLQEQPNQPSQEFHIFINCSGLFPFLELTKKKDMNFLSSLVVYNYLHTPARLLSNALLKMKRYHVRSTPNPIDPNYDVTPGLRNLNIPITIIHPQIPANTLRATPEELNLLCKTFPEITCHTPKEGYDITDASQFDLMQRVIKRDINHIYT